VLSNVSLHIIKPPLPQEKSTFFHKAFFDLTIDKEIMSKLNEAFKDGVRPSLALRSRKESR
jgi:hypothetical protein